MKYILLFIMLISNPTHCGILFCAPKTRTHATKPSYSYSGAIVRDQEKRAKELFDQREQEIIKSISAIPLPQIFILHQRSKTVDFSKYNLDDDEIKVFRAAVATRFEENRAEIELICRDSIERYRVSMLTAPAREKMRSRRSRLPAGNNLASHSTQLPTPI